MRPHPPGGMITTLWSQHSCGRTTVQTLAKLGDHTHFGREVLHSGVDSEFGYFLDCNTAGSENMQYISPEAIEGEVVDNRSDIYSLGCTAFHLLAGKPPFTGTSIASTMSAHLTKPVPSISAVNEHLPAKTDAVFERVLAKNPDDRYQSCAEFVTAIQEAVGVGEVRYPASAPTLAAATSSKRRAVDPDAPTQLRKGEAVPAPPVRKSRAVPVLAAAVGVLAVAAAALGLYANRGGSGGTSTTQTSTTATATSTPPPMPTTTSSPAPSSSPPPAVAETIVPAPTQTRTVTTTVAAPPQPYEGMPCSESEVGQKTADGTLYCSPVGMYPSWQDLTHQSRPAVQQGSACTEPGARARVQYTDGIATCKAGPGGSLVWGW